MTTVRSQEIWREHVRHEEHAQKEWWKTYRDTENFTRQPQNLTPARTPVPTGDYLVPGYSGHVPQQQFSFAKTFGKMSRDAGAYEGKAGRPEGTRTMASYPVAPRLPRIQPRETLQPVMDYHPPGYGGFVPGKQFAFGTTYGNVTRDSIRPLQEQYAQGRARRAQTQDQYSHNRRSMLRSMRG